MSWFKNPGSQLFGSGYNPSRDVAKNYLQQRGNLSGAYQNRLDQSTAAVNRFDPMYQAALRSRVSYLQEQPFASEQDALALGRASTANAAQYGGARTNLARMLASRGIGGGIEAGALANLEGARMGQLASAQYQTALARIAARNAAQQEALGLLGGARSMYSGEQQGALAGLADLYGTQAGYYGNVGAQEAAQKQATQGMVGQMIQAYAQSQGVPTSGSTRSQERFAVMGEDGQTYYVDANGNIVPGPTRATPMRASWGRRAYDSGWGD